MRWKCVFFVLLILLTTISVAAQSDLAEIPAVEVTRVREFYRLCDSIQNEVWSGWNAVPAPLLLITEKAEFLTHHPSPPSEFTKVSQDWQFRKRQFPLSFQATFPAFGPPSVIVIGEPRNTQSQTSTPVSENDRKYFSFQLWQEGIARYTELRSAEIAGRYTPAPEFAALPDYEPLTQYAERVRKKTLDELKQADLATWKRTVVYSFGAAEGFLLDRINPGWKEQ